MAGCDSHLYGTHGNGTCVIRILEQEAIETGFALETGNDVLSLCPVLGREVQRPRRLSSYPYPYDLQSLFLRVVSFVVCALSARGVPQASRLHAFLISSSLSLKVSVPCVGL